MTRRKAPGRGIVGVARPGGLEGEVPGRGRPERFGGEAGSRHRSHDGRDGHPSVTLLGHPRGGKINRRSMGYGRFMGKSGYLGPGFCALLLPMRIISGQGDFDRDHTSTEFMKRWFRRTLIGNVCICLIKMESFVFEIPNFLCSMRFINNSKI